MSVRSDIAAKLTTENPSFIVKAYPVSPEPIPTGKVAVNVYRERFEVADSNGYITHYLKVTVGIPKKNSAAAEDELDAAVDAVMLTLEKLKDVFWQDATRTILGGDTESYEINLQAVRPQIYKSKLLTNS